MYPSRDSERKILWYEYNGIYQPVWKIVSHNNHIKTSKVHSGSGIIQFKISINSRLVTQPIKNTKG